MRAVLLAAVVVLAAWATPAHAQLPGTTARATPREVGRWPVDGTVVRGHDDVGPYAAGHRGVDLAVAPGTPVRPMRGGRVTFAGPVAGTTWVTVDHGDGRRSSYGPLAAPVVRAGAAVTGATTLGTAAGGHGAAPPGSVLLHVGVRRDDRYVDPATLLGVEPRWRPALVGPGGWVAADAPTVVRLAPWSGETTLGVVEGSRRATRPGWSTPPNPNHLVAVAGLGSTSERVPFDATLLGHDPADVTHLSYAGRRDHVGEPARDPDPRRDQLPYDVADVDAGVAAAARLLEAQLRAQWAREPGRAVDLVGHSMGGVVVLRYLLLHHDPADPGLPPIGHVVTLASPLGGADLATAARLALHDPVLGLVHDDVADALGAADPGGQAVADLALGALAEEHAAAWAAVLGDPWGSPLAGGTRVLTIAAQGDLAVPDQRARLPSSDEVAVPHVVVPGGHASGPASEAALQVVHAFLSGEPLPGGDRGWSTIVDVPLGWLQRATGAAVGLG